MISYVLIALGSLVAALVCVFAFRLISNASSQAVDTVQHAPGGNNNTPARFTHLNSNVASARKPWGWGSGKNPAYAGKFSEASGSHHALPDRVEKLQDVERRGKPGSRVPWGWTGSESLNEARLAAEVESSSTNGSVRNVLAGYDLAGSKANGEERTVSADAFDARRSQVSVNNPAKPANQRKPVRQIRRTRKPTSGGVSKPWGW